MSKNLTVTQLDAGQVFKRVYDEANDCVRVEVGGGTSFELNLDATAGDTVGVQGNGTQQKSSLTNASTGVVIAPFSCVGMKSFNLYTNTTATLTGAQVCTLQVSPSDTDNVWISTSLTITPSGTNGTVIMGTANSAIVARRAQVIIAAAISTGTFDLYLVAQGN